MLRSASGSEPPWGYSGNAVSCRIGWDACHHLSIKNGPTLTLARDRRQSILSNRMCSARHSRVRLGEVAGGIETVTRPSNRA